MIKVLLANLIATSLGLIIIVHMASLQTSAQTQKKARQVIDHSNNDYSFPTQKDFKDHPMAKQKKQTSTRMQSFDAIRKKKAQDAPRDTLDLDDEIQKYHKEDEIRERKEAEAEKVDLKAFYAEYVQYQQKQKALERKVQDEMAKELDDLTVSDEDSQLMNLDDE